jgi:SAM-dependent methyltransferase
MTALGAELPTVRTTVAQALQGHLPERYDAGFDVLWRAAFDREVEGVLRPGMTVLDAGSGASPAVALDRRPAGTHYVGLDISAAELQRAGAVYDETVVGDVSRPQPELDGRFDLVVSLFLLEHVPDVGAALETMRAALKPGGTLVCQLAGGKCLPALLNRSIPHDLKVKLVHRLNHRSTESVFPARYDRCTHSDLTALLAPWSEATVRPLFNGGIYFGFSKVAMAAYLWLEELLLRAGRVDAANWYLVSATR